MFQLVQSWFLFDLFDLCGFWLLWFQKSVVWMLKLFVNTILSRKKKSNFSALICILLKETVLSVSLIKTDLFRFPLINSNFPNQSQLLSANQMPRLWRHSDSRHLIGWSYPLCSKTGTKSRELGEKILRYAEVILLLNLNIVFGKIC